MKLQSLFFFLALATLCCAKQIEKNINFQELEEKINFFYLDPTPTAAKGIINEVNRYDNLESFLGIFTALSRYYPKEILNWINEAKISFEHHPRLIDALYMGGLQGEAIQLALQIQLPAQKILSFGNQVQSFLTIPVNFLGSVQYMCSHFYISGDARYGKRIIDALEVTSNEMANPKELKELKIQAQAILKELIFNHEKIYHLCLEESKSRKGFSRDILNELLTAQLEEQKKAFPNQNGILSGMILTTDNTDFENQWEHLLTMEGPVFNKVSSMPYPNTPQENKTIRVLILFNGYELDTDLNAHLSYDLEILDPKGDKVADFHNLSALKRKIPSRFFSQKADQPIIFSITSTEKDEDPCLPGIFTINAVLKDHIAKKDLKLTTTFELLPPDQK